MSFSKISALGGLIAFASRVAAHGSVTGIVADGVYYEGYSATFQYLPTQPVVVAWSTPEDLGNGFIAPAAYTTSEIICHLGATNAQTSATVKAGGTVEMQWTAWPTSHKGPVIDYLAKCTNDDCTAVDKTTLSFFKIDGVGLLSDADLPGTWASDTLIANNNSWTVTIPTDIAPGNYVLRHEIIALHSAGSLNGAQNYPFCFNLAITGSGTATPAGSLGTELYHEPDPGIEINIYAAISTYVVPGPALYSGPVSVSQTVESTATAVASVGSITTSSDAGAVTTHPVITTSSSSALPTVTSSLAAPYGNSTISKNGTTTKKTNSACKVKPTSSSVTFLPATTTALLIETTSSSPPSPPTFTTSPSLSPSPTTTTTPPSLPTFTSSPTATTTTIPKTTEIPKGTTLNTLLFWLSSFYDKYARKGEGYDSKTVMVGVGRRHARDLEAGFV